MSVVVIHKGMDNAARVEALRKALGPTGDTTQTVVIRADIDLTGEPHIAIADNRKLIASAECRRSARRLGPRICVRPEDERGRAPLFEINGDNVLISGFRLEGPTNYIAQGERYEQGIRVSPLATDKDGRPLPPISNIEICNMEIYHWSGVGVQVGDNVLKDEDGKVVGPGRLSKDNADAVCVRRSYIHHNRHGAGYGYGVEATGGAHATFQQNVFDENRHAIAGGSKHKDADDYSGYIARENLILEGGGVHCLEPVGARNSGFWGLAGAIGGGLIGFAIGGPPGAAIGAGIGLALLGGGALAKGLVCWQTHQIDMHGTKSSAVWGDKCCGTAGETIIIERNTILYDGTPRAKEAVLAGLVGALVLGAIGGLFGGPVGAAAGASTGAALGSAFVLSRTGYAIKIRGNPRDRAVVDGNVFKHKSWDDAVEQNGESGGSDITKHVENKDNVFNSDDLTSEVGQADFADKIDCGSIDERDFGGIVGEAPPPAGDEFPGDPGRRDDFMATGVTWWARSHATGQWRYLNTMKEKLPDLQLGKYDHADDIWDVAPRARHPGLPPEKYSRNGTSGWIDRNVIHP